MTKIKPPERINEEYVCIDSFIQHLKEIDNKKEIKHNEEPNDPPDFWVTISGVTYAVEVTSIVTDYAYNALCKKLVKDIRSEFLTSSYPKGKYALSIMRRPDIPKRGTTAWRTFVSTTATKIQEMSNASCGVESCLLKDSNGYLVIEKWSNQGTEIGLCKMEVMKWEGEVREEFIRILKERIETKRERLKDIIPRCSNIILLFYDAYGYGDVEDVKKAFLNIQGYEWLHSIYLATPFSDMPNKLYPNTPGRRGVFGYSKNEQWH